MPHKFCYLNHMQYNTRQFRIIQTKTTPIRTAFKFRLLFGLYVDFDVLKKGFLKALVGRYEGCIEPDG